MKHVSLRPLTMVFAVCLLAACKPGGGSSGSDSNIDAVTPEVPAVAADEAAQKTGFEGTWDDCAGFNSTSSRHTYVFGAGNTYSQHYAVFESPDCSGEPLQDVELQGGKYELLGETVDSSGMAVREINFHVEYVSVFERSELPAADQYFTYNIVTPPDSTDIYFGGSWEFTAEQRPTALDIERPFRQR